MTTIGTIAPDFTLPGIHASFTLGQALAQGPLLLIFYPKDNTPG